MDMYIYSCSRYYTISCFYSVFNCATLDPQVHGRLFDVPYTIENYFTPASKKKSLIYWQKRKQGQ